MILLHQIGERINSNFNTIEEILALSPSEPISFDGVYESVYKNYKKLKGRTIVFFVMGKYVGKDNSFDVGQPKSKYCTWQQIIEMSIYLRAAVGYHSFSHRDLTKLSDEEIKEEIKPPFPMPFFAYPYGAVDDRVSSLVKQAGYKEAWSVTQGNGEYFQRKRRYLNW